MDNLNESEMLRNCQKTPVESDTTQLMEDWKKIQVKQIQRELLRRDQMLRNQSINESIKRWE